MTIEQVGEVDFVTVDHSSGDVWLTISDHLSWDTDEGRHLLLLQEKLNAYLRFIETGELIAKIPEAVGRSIVINLVGKFSPTEKGALFLESSKAAIAEAGVKLQFSLLTPQ
jgi:hypothetical protein